MVHLKSPAEIQLMREGGAILSQAMRVALELVRPGVTLKEIDEAAEASLCEQGAVPSFKGYQSHPEDTPFPSTMCLSVNEEVVHGLGNREYVLKEGDVLGLDMGCWYKEMCTDMAVTVEVGIETERVHQLLSVTKKALLNGVEAAQPGKSLFDISQAIEETIQPSGFGIVRALGGHGVGFKVHEPPFIPNFTTKQYKNEELKPGMCLALEPMVGMGDYEVGTAEDGWSVVMKDGELSAHFEVTVAITEKGPEILTPLPV